MLKKKICKFFLWNFHLFLFFFPKKIEINQSLKLTFSLRLYFLFKNFDYALKIKFILLLILINILSIIFYFKLFKTLNYKQKEIFIKRLSNLNINNLSRGILALKSQSIIVFYSILKGNLDDK
tara:strand:+ start:1324 stop:1692 length:369 start_codon:yes stop_codon:yes gene_type:complete